MFILKKGHKPGVYVPLRALFLVLKWRRQSVDIFLQLIEPCCDKAGLRGFRPGRHKTDCTATEDS